MTSATKIYIIETMTYDTGKALHLAVQAHGSQMYGVLPYRYHLVAVADELFAILKSSPSMMFYDIDLAMSAAYLHDSLEDTSLIFETIETEIGYPVAVLVDAVTDEPGKNRKERKLATYPKINAHGPLALALKLADRIANIKFCIKNNNTKLFNMYKDEFKDFRSALYKYNDTDGLTSTWQNLEDLLGL